MTRTPYSALIATLLALGATANASAITLSFVPDPVLADLGDPVEVGVQISDLGAFSAPSLGGFELNVVYDIDVLDFVSAEYGDPVLGDQLDLAGFGSISVPPSEAPPGTVALGSVSVDLATDLDTLQVGEFILATLTFNSVGAGTSPLTLSDVVLSDPLGLQLVTEIVDGSVTVTDPGDPTVPEPSTLILLTSALFGAGIAYRVRRSKSANPAQQPSD